MRFYKKHWIKRLKMLLKEIDFPTKGDGKIFSIAITSNSGSWVKEITPVDIEMRISSNARGGRSSDGLERLIKILEAIQGGDVFFSRRERHLKNWVLDVKAGLDDRLTMLCRKSLNVNTRVKAVTNILKYLLCTRANIEAISKALSITALYLICSYVDHGVQHASMFVTHLRTRLSRPRGSRVTQCFLVNNIQKINKSFDLKRLPSRLAPLRKYMPSTAIGLMKDLGSRCPVGSTCTKQYPL